VEITVAIDFATTTDGFSSASPNDTLIRITLCVGIAAIIDVPESHLLADAIE